MKAFSRPEIRAVALIFLVLIAVSIPNFMISLRRARDQVRKDDMGGLQKQLGEYLADFGTFPAASDDGRIVACKKPGDTVEVDKMGKLIVNFIPCDWGKDALVNLTPGSNKIYIPLLPREPDYQKGVSYRYLSDGQHAQILVALEGKDEPEYDEKIIARGVMCGNVVCNAGRAYGCPTNKSFEQCAAEEMAKLKK